MNPSQPTVTIRALAPVDRVAWNDLWQGYQHFYGVALPPSVSDAAWLRLHDANAPMFGIGAVVGDRLIGFAHYLFHLSTWLTSETCYLQDLFVDPAHRGRGIARALLDEVYARADARGAGQVYWLTHESNVTARRLYDTVATHAGFISYERYQETPSHD